MDDYTKQLVAEAGYANGLDIMHDFYQLELLQRTAEALKQSWDAVGMRATLTGVERTAFVSKLQVSNFQSANSWRQWGESDPEAYSSRLISGGVANFAQFADPEMDKCMEEGQGTFDVAKRTETYKRCWKMIYEDALVGGSVLRPFFVVYNKAMKGLAYQSYAMDLREVWLDK